MSQTLVKWYIEDEEVVLLSNQSWFEISMYERPISQVTIEVKDKELENFLPKIEQLIIGKINNEKFFQGVIKTIFPQGFGWSLDIVSEDNDLYKLFITGKITKSKSVKDMLEFIWNNVLSKRDYKVNRIDWDELENVFFTEEGFFQNTKVGDMLDDLANISNCYWWIDFQRNFNFVKKGLYEEGKIAITTNSSNIYDISFSEEQNDYANEIIFQGSSSGKGLETIAVSLNNLDTPHSEELAIDYGNGIIETDNGIFDVKNFLITFDAVDPPSEQDETKNVILEAIYNEEYKEYDVYNVIFQQGDIPDWVKERDKRFVEDFLTDEVIYFLGGQQKVFSIIPIFWNSEGYFDLRFSPDNILIEVERIKRLSNYISGSLEIGIENFKFKVSDYFNEGRGDYDDWEYTYIYFGIESDYGIPSKESRSSIFGDFEARDLVIGEATVEGNNKKLHPIDDFTNVLNQDRVTFQFFCIPKEPFPLPARIPKWWHKIDIDANYIPIINVKLQWREKKWYKEDGIWKWKPIVSTTTTQVKVADFSQNTNNTLLSNDPNNDVTQGYKYELEYYKENAIVVVASNSTEKEKIRDYRGIVEGKIQKYIVEENIKEFSDATKKANSYLDFYTTPKYDITFKSNKYIDFEIGQIFKNVDLEFNKVNITGDFVLSKKKDTILIDDGFAPEIIQEITLTNNISPDSEFSIFNQKLKTKLISDLTFPIIETSQEKLIFSESYEITGSNKYLFPRENLFPKNDLYPKDTIPLLPSKSLKPNHYVFPSKDLENIKAKRKIAKKIRIRNNV